MNGPEHDLWTHVHAALDAGRDPFGDAAVVEALIAHPEAAEPVARLSEVLGRLSAETPVGAPIAGKSAASRPGRRVPIETERAEPSTAEGPSMLPRTLPTWAAVALIALTVATLVRTRPGNGAPGSSSTERTPLASRSPGRVLDWALTQEVATPSSRSVVVTDDEGSHRRREGAGANGRPADRWVVEVSSRRPRPAHALHASMRSAGVGPDGSSSPSRTTYDPGLSAPGSTALPTALPAAVPTAIPGEGQP